MSEYNQAFDPNILIGHCDLISRFSDFALYLDTQLVYFHNFFQIMSEYDQTFDPNILIGHCDLISRFSDFAYISLLKRFMNKLLSKYVCVCQDL